jgi:hypothetical protein
MGIVLLSSDSLSNAISVSSSRPARAQAVPSLKWASLDRIILNSLLGPAISGCASAPDSDLDGAQLVRHPQAAAR